MKLRDFYLQTQTALDDFKLQHLIRWAERHAPTSEDPDELVPRMVRFIETLDKEDREFQQSRGWTAVFDAMEAVK